MPKYNSINEDEFLFIRYVKVCVVFKLYNITFGGFVNFGRFWAWNQRTPLKKCVYPICNSTVLTFGIGFSFWSFHTSEQLWAIDQSFNNLILNFSTNWDCSNANWVGRFHYAKLHPVESRVWSIVISVAPNRFLQRGMRSRRAFFSSFLQLTSVVVYKRVTGICARFHGTPGRTGFFCSRSSLAKPNKSLCSVRSPPALADKSQCCDYYCNCNCIGFLHRPDGRIEMTSLQVWSVGG